ncbi:MAG: arginine N-succinyltransferase [Pirellulaceae bacterium]|nr:arginine N-succinyltransferase [Pirellulaceae bacterium]
MIIVRAATLDDANQLWNLINQATFGMTTLQITREQLNERIECSHFAFARKTERPGSDLYVFVMEDLAKHQLVGTSCIFSKTGGYEPFYSYRRVFETARCERLGKSQEIESLQLQKIHDGPTEIGSLFLDPAYRGRGRGRLLSLARFVFIARHPKRFADQVIAEMRGVVNDDGTCPFWEVIGRHFFDMEFPQADSLSTIDKRFIEELMPHHPIYVCLLPPEGRAVIGKVHPDTEPALAMLRDEGFRVVDLIDIFDGGPVVHCARDEIAAVKRVIEAPIIEIAEQLDAPESILASRQGGFRSMLGAVRQTDTGLIIPDIVALTLGVREGDPLAVLSPKG